VLDTVDASGVESASWIGASFGGRLILEIASCAPGRVERAILLDPALQQSPSTSLQNAERERIERFFQSAEEAIRERLGSPMYGKTPREFLEEDTAQHLEPMPDGRFRFRYCHSAVVAAWGELCLPLPRLRTLPTLVVTGRESGFVTEEQMKPLRAQVGDSLTEVTVPGGHAVLWDAFPRVADEIDAFLAARSRHVKNEA
jgi:lipase